MRCVTAHNQPMETNNSEQTVAVKIHPFEKAGLGKAPFRCVGVENRVGPINLGGGMTSGAPGQPMGTCDYCGTGIANCFHIVSSDGKRFIVGCDCVARTDAKGCALRTEVDRELKKLQKSATDARIARAFELFDADKALRDQFSDGAFDYIEFCRKNAGRSGKLAIARRIEKMAAGTPAPADVRS